MGHLELLLTMLMGVQGEALKLSYPHDTGLEQVSLNWDEQIIPFFLKNDSWEAVIGIDLDREPKEYSINILLIYENKEKISIERKIEVSSKSFPTTELVVAPQYVQLSEENQQRASREAEEINKIYNSFSSSPYWKEQFIVPVKNTTTGTNFGHRRIFNGEPRAPHSGADLKASKGTEVLASNSGKIVLAKNLFFSGNAIFIDHGLGIYSTYLHLSEILVEIDSFVERGQVIGLAGDTGRVTGPHLHWGVRIMGARVDPFSLLKL